MSSSGAPRGSVQSVARALDVLELLSDAGGTATLSALASASGLPLPTIHRLVRTLVDRGYLRQLPSRAYALGPRLIRLGEGAARQSGSAARPHLVDLAGELGESANLAVLDGDMAVYVAQAASRNTMRMFTEVGRRVHTHCTGVGKALLAQLADREVAAIVQRAGMPSPTDRTLTDPEALLAELSGVRERGYAVDDGEQEIGVRCYAVPVPDAPTPTALSVSGPDSRVTPAFAERAVPVLERAARQISADLSA
jgi:IclR family transcriptional regulator, acetate operon repressor